MVKQQRQRWFFPFRRATAKTHDDREGSQHGASASFAQSRLRREQSFANPLKRQNSSGKIRSFMVLTQTSDAVDDSADHDERIHDESSSEAVENILLLLAGCLPGLPAVMARWRSIGGMDVSLERVFSRASERLELAPGTIFIEQGQRCDSIFLIAEGVVVME